jgi:hypothetical protein
VSGKSIIVPRISWPPWLRLRLVATMLLVSVWGR